MQSDVRGYPECLEWLVSVDSKKRNMCRLRVGILALKALEGDPLHVSAFRSARYYYNKAFGGSTDRL
ncbi:MAG: hypothetical protein KatS3mg042_0608 [Rhodothermaceae bacterium]|nr:MAG: hypothetical protein KatS3mg042_0608 [Rhodothermaceae bacterium]